MSDFVNQNHLQCSVNSTIPDIPISHKMNRLVAFVSAFIVNFLFGFTLMIFKKLLVKRKKSIMGQEIQNICVDEDYKLLNSLQPFRGFYRARSCPPTFKFNRFNSIQDPATLTLKQLQRITEIDETADSENTDDYAVGGYMPIHFGKQIGTYNKYFVLRKLGWGHFSTVWLCEDLSQRQMRGPHYYAVKILKSSNVFTTVALDEVRLLRCVKEKDVNSIGYNRIILLHEYFTESSEFGIHTCLTFEIMGPSLLELLSQSYFQGLHQTGVKRIIKQVLEGLIYLHEVCRIIHTDIKPENILIKVQDSYVRSMVGYVKRYRELGAQMPRSYVSSLKWKEHVELYGQASSSDKPVAAQPPRSRENISWPKDMYKKCASKSPKKGSKDDLSSLMFIDPNIQVKIADLGNACWENEHFAAIIQTIQYRALEVIIDADYSFSADMWSLACVAFEMSTGEYLFNPHSSPHFSSEDDHLGQIWEVLDGIPKYIALSGKQSKNFFDPTGKLKNITMEHLKIWKVEDVLVDKYGWKRVDAILFADFIQSLIEPDPDLRATASQAMGKKWLRDLDNN